MSSGIRLCRSLKVRPELASGTSRASLYCISSHNTVRQELPERCLPKEGGFLEKEVLTCIRMAGVTGRGSRRQKYSTVYKGVRDSRAGSLFWSRRWSSPFWLGLTLVRESHHSWESALGNTKVSDLCGEFITESSWSSDLWSWFQFIKYLSKICKWDYVRSENGDRCHLLQTWNVLTQHRKRPSKWVEMDQLICFFVQLRINGKHPWIPLDTYRFLFTKSLSERILHFSEPWVYAGIRITQ